MKKVIYIAIDQSCYDKGDILCAGYDFQMVEAEAKRQCHDDKTDNIEWRELFKIEEQLVM